MKQFLVVSLLLMAAAMSSCGAAGVVTEYKVRNDGDVVQDKINHIETVTLGIGDLLVKANARRADIIKPDYNWLMGLTYGRAAEIIDISIFSQAEMVEIVTAEEAIADVELYFEALRQLYGSYMFFGGDDIFLPIRDGIIAELSTRDSWPLQDFAWLVFLALNDVINDNHLMFAGGRFSPQTAVSVSDSIRFGRSSNGFYNIETGIYISGLVGDVEHKPEQVLRLTLDEEGNLFWTAILAHTGITTDEYTLTVNYADGTSGQLVLREAGGEPIEFHEPRLEKINGIPVASVRRAHFSTPAEEGMRQTFLSFAEALRGEPVFILDVRSNGGGNGTVPSNFLYKLTGKMIPTNFAWMFRWDYEVYMELIRQPGLSIRYEDVLKFFAPQPFGEAHMIAFNAPDRVVENEQLIILLIDRYTGSAGEMFADLILNMENTLIIGQNTAGQLHADTTYSMLTLPNSGLPFSIGRAIMLHPEGHNIEGLGIAPDIWVHGDALAAALALLAATEN